MSDIAVEDINFFKDPSIHLDPYPYFDALREKGPIWQEPYFGVYMVTGYDEALTVYNDATNFSSCNTVAGPFTTSSVEKPSSSSDSLKCTPGNLLRLLRALLAEGGG